MVNFRSRPRTFWIFAITARASRRWRRRKHGAALTGADRPEAISGCGWVKGFGLLGEQPLLGRTLQAEDYQQGKDHVLVLSHKLWQRAFGGDPNIIGRRLMLSSYAVVGVMPARFQFPPFWSTRGDVGASRSASSRDDTPRGESLRVLRGSNRVWRCSRRRPRLTR